MKFISVVTPCFEEEENVEELYLEVKKVIEELGGYTYEHIFIDNASTDGTVRVLKEIAARDKNVKIIVNTRNFGYARSPFHALLQTSGEAVVLLAADLQDPPYLIRDFLRKWEEGYKVVLAVKPQSEETYLLSLIKKFYYNLISRLSSIRLVKNATGFGLYDKQVISILRQLDEPYPYLRGLVSDIGFDIAQVEFFKPARKRGLSKSNFYALYEIAMQGITSHSKVPLRLATFTGFVSSFICLILGLVYLVYKLVMWQIFSVGMAPLVIGLFFFASVQLFFLGIIGEYIGSIQAQVMRRPLVFEKERINFD